MFRQVKCESTMEAAMNAVAHFNALGVAGSMSFLPVLTNSHDGVEREIRTYIMMLDGIATRKLDCDVTLKLHQLGVYGALGMAEAAVRRIATHARKRNNFVWVDMERPDTVDATIELCRSLWADGGRNIGICLQSYLTRTERDMATLSAHGIPVRLVKGFYKGYDQPSWRAVTANYARLMPALLTHNSYPAIATHDRELIAQAEHFIRAHALERKAELQFFRGVRDDVAVRVAASGLRSRVYVPFGGLSRFVRSGLSSFDLWHQLERMLGFMPWA